MKRRKSRGTLQQSLSQQLRVQSPNLNTKPSNKSLHSSPRYNQVLLRSDRSTRFPKNCTKKDSFKSLESLFDLSKPIQLNVEDFLAEVPQSENLEKLEEDQSESCRSSLQSDRLEDNIEKLRPAFVDSDSTPLLIDELTDEDTKSENDSVDKIEDISVLSGIEEDSVSEMSDQEISEGQDGAEDARSTRTQKTAKSGACATKELTDKDSLYAPAYDPLPPCIGEGIVVGCGKNRDSVMSAMPVPESYLFEEILCDGKRANTIRKQIEELKSIIKELTCKEKLSEEDTLTLKCKQEELMQKIGELNEITRKIQRAIGMIDPSSITFAKMFEMLPYPHKPCGRTICGDDKNDDPCTKLDDCTTKPCQKFAFPQIDYEEDKLPRLIVCGNTEETFPKIVIADSRPKSRGNKCLEDLTGRLSESLCLQEKLAKENACLEGGKFQLEKELLEKDSALECLERKICGLQAEMRMIVQENSELTRKMKGIEQQQQQQRSCSPTPRACPEADCPSPRKPEFSDLSCKCSSREQSARPACPTASPRSCQKPGQSCNTARLYGGGSHGDMLRQSGGGGCGKQTTSQSQRGKTCPVQIEEKLAAYGTDTKHLSEQLTCIENTVSNLKSELMYLQHEKQLLSQQQKLLECANSCATCNPDQPKSACKSIAPQNSMTCLPCNDAPECASQQLRDLREQYARLQDDYKNKLCEVSRLRSDAESLKRDAREAKEERERLEIKLTDAQERARVIESERNELLGSKELLVEQEQAILVAKQRYREVQDELEELRTMIRDQAAQIDDYRNKYLQAQQQVEEQLRQLDLMEMDNARMNENVTLEIGRVKNQFQEKLAELAPLPDILKQTQVKLQETQQLRMLAEHNCEDLSRELLTAKDRIDAMQTQINDLQREIEVISDEKTNGDGRLDELERKNSELRTENERLKNAVARFEEQQCTVQKKLDEKQHEIVQLNATLEQVREDSARQVSRTKERCEAIKKSMQSQISEFEIQLAQCRAVAKTAQKERDEIRQKMQGQIVNLNEALQQAQGRIKSLQGHVDYLKVSYSNVFGGQGSGESPIPQMEMPLSGQGYDSCDCNH
ncbi:centrosome-associated protein CEP250 [Phymastichus coffea]|uniref:centrosome-associated protein CEP250 n=1 Tax=Phymastichus coffea TaxID=108790 RepID=UPI00273B7B8C|nr:centrosome-associated protein CEP250 [Phymastichus coffea]